MTLDRNQPPPATVPDPRAAFGSDAACHAFQLGVAQRRALFVETGLRPNHPAVCLVAAPDVTDQAQVALRQADRDPKAGAALFAHLVRMWYLALLGRRRRSQFQQANPAAGDVIVVSSLMLDAATMGTAAAMAFVRAMHGQALVYAIALLGAAADANRHFAGLLPVCVVVCPGAKEPSLCQAWRAGLDRGLQLYCGNDRSRLRIPVYLDPRGDPLLFAAAIPDRGGVLVAGCHWSVLVATHDHDTGGRPGLVDSVRPRLAVTQTGIADSLAGDWWEGEWAHVAPRYLELPQLILSDSPAASNPGPPVPKKKRSAETPQPTTRRGQGPARPAKQAKPTKRQSKRKLSATSGTGHRGDSAKKRCRR